GKLRFTPSENLDLIFTVVDQKGRGEGTQTQYWNIQDEHLTLMQAFDPESEGDLGDYRHSADTPDGGTEWQTDYSLRATLTAADHDFIFIGNVSDQEGIGSLDIDYGPIPLLRGSGNRVIDQHSLELRAVSNFGDWFEYVAGLYYFHGNRLHNTHITLLPVLGTSEVTDALIPALVGGVLGDVLPNIGPFQTESFYTRFDQQTDSYSAYGQMTGEILDKLTLIVGARYSVDKKSVDFIGTATGPAGAPTPAILLNYSLGVEDFHLIDERTDSSFDPKISLVYNLNEDINIYGTVATGYKNGGFNAQAWTSTAKLSFEPETSISFEAGVKGDYLDGAGRGSIAVFRSEFDDLQASVWDGTTFIVDNAATVITQGVEIETQTMLPWDIFTIASFAYLDAKYESFEKGPCVAGSDEDFCDVSGHRLPSPEFQAMASVNYVNVLGNMPLDFFVGVDANWQSKVQFAADGDPLDSQDAHALFNARLGVMGDDQSWNFMIYVRNLEDKVVKRASFDATLLSGTHVAYVQPPRTFSAHFSVNF
ncbi:MAG: TonB-dependent receptor, partial [Alphaproteobacteria bacterium]